MAYSIYAYFHPKFLRVVDDLKLEIIAEFFEDEWRRKVIQGGTLEDGLVFYYCKPRGDAAKEQKLFSEFELLRQEGLLVEISADDLASEKPLIEKMVNYPELHFYVDETSG